MIKNNASETPDLSLEKQETAAITPSKKSMSIAGIIVMCLSLIMAVASFLLIKGTIGSGALAMSDSYHNAYASECNSAHDTWYDTFFNMAEAENHVANRVEISIGDIRETANLEVLQVSDIEYIIQNDEDNGEGITAWLAVPGNGEYVVNLQAAEFIVDNSNNYVLVRIPRPQLTNITIDYANVEKLRFMNDIFNDSYSVGEKVAKEMLDSADEKIKTALSSNQYFYEEAQKSACSTIECLVKQFNIQIPDIKVDVEFFEK